MAQPVGKQDQAKRLGWLLAILFGVAVLAIVQHMGFLKPSADVVDTSQTIDFTSETNLKQGTFDGVELKNGVLQLKEQP